MIKGIQKRVGKRTCLVPPRETLLESLIRSFVVAVFSLNQKEGHSGGKQKEILLYSIPVSVHHPEHPSSDPGIVLDLLTSETPCATHLKSPQSFFLNDFFQYCP